MYYSAIKAIEYYVPETILSNEMLEKAFPDFSSEKMLMKTGIKQRYISGEDETAVDMAIQAATKLFFSSEVEKTDIDFILFCTQTPDYLLPTSACIIQDRLALNKNVGAFDFNLGCSGYVYGLSIARSLIESGQAKNILLLTGDTYTKLLDPDDRSVRIIFGDAATATWVGGVKADFPFISRAQYGTDGSGQSNLYVHGGGMRHKNDTHIDPYLRMKGPEIFEFTLDVVPKICQKLIEKESLSFNDLEMFVFHQANRFMLDHLRKKMGIPADKFLISMDMCGNTVSSSIPIALKNNIDEVSQLRRVLLCGFGVGYSWGANVVNLRSLA